MVTQDCRPNGSGLTRITDRPTELCEGACYGRSEMPRPAQSPFVVLKYGGSVLSGPDDLSGLVSCVAAWRALERRPLLIVSAYRGETDRLFAEAEARGLDDAELASHVGNGEERVADDAARALAEAGLTAARLTVESLDFIATGRRLEADPFALEVDRLRAALNDADVAVLPGFVAVHNDGGRALLGRGGSDLSAVFLARALGLDEAHLTKDVPGVAAEGRERWYRTLSFEDALTLPTVPVQRRALALAYEARVDLLVDLPRGLGAPHAVGGTRVQRGTTELAPEWTRQ